MPVAGSTSGMGSITGKGAFSGAATCFGAAGSLGCWSDGAHAITAGTAIRAAMERGIIVMGSQFDGKVKQSVTQFEPARIILVKPRKREPSVIPGGSLNLD